MVQRLDIAKYQDRKSVLERELDDLKVTLAKESAGICKKMCFSNSRNGTFFSSVIS